MIESVERQSIPGVDRLEDHELRLAQMRRDDAWYTLKECEGAIWSMINTFFRNGDASRTVTSELVQNMEEYSRQRKKHFEAQQKVDEMLAKTDSRGVK